MPAVIVRKASILNMEFEEWRADTLDEAEGARSSFFDCLNMSRAQQTAIWRCKNDDTT